VLILTIRTDNPEAEIGLYEDATQLAYVTWTAHKQLAETIHLKIAQLLDTKGHTLHNLQGIACYEGPGSFTGLRIGLTVANALAQGLGVPIVGAQQPAWLESGLQSILCGKNDTIVLPFYGAEVHITAQKK